MNLRPELLIACLGLSIMVAIAAVSSGGCQYNNPADRSALVEYGAKLEKCQEVGREAGSYQAYEDCTVEAGLR